MLVTDYIDAIDNDRRRGDARKVLELYEEITNLPAVMWGSIVGFGKYHYRYESGREGDMPAACFAPRKANLVFYVGDEFDGAEQLFTTLGKHKKSKACLYVNKLADINIDVLKEIVRRGFEKTISRSS